ncbi:MAG: hypothetical protein AAGC68_00480 [Verrucomicrobiota bacterium]
MRIQLAKRLGIIGIVVFSSAISPALSQDPEAKPLLKWHHSYAAALAEARESGKPLFLEFRCAP